MEFTIRLERLLVIFLIAGIVAIAARRLRVPYTVGLVLAGIGLSFRPLFSDVPFTKDLIFNVLLPPLVFEAALQIRWRELRRDSPVVGVLATVGVCLSAAVTALGMKYVAGWEWISALLFGALIAATDPVSVIATFKEAGVHGRLRLLVESESLLNDGTAAVAFTVILAAAAVGGAPSIGSIAQTLSMTTAGGVVIGILTGGIISFLMRRAEDPLVEFTFTTVAAYSSFMLAEQFHFSGILACVTAGVLIGNAGLLGDSSSPSRRVDRTAVSAYWEYLGFLANSLIFIGIGIHQVRQDFAGILIPAGAAIIVVLLGRALTVYSCCALFGASRLNVSRKYQHVLFWGGLRGALALALATGLPDWVPGREEVIAVTFAVVGFSILVQGLSMTPLLRRLGEIGDPPLSRGFGN